MIKKYRKNPSCEKCTKNPFLCSKGSIYNPKDKYIMICLNLTDRCNMDCSYCFERVRKKTFRDIEKENIDALFDLFKKEIPEYSPFFSFMGGEPTLRLDMVEYTLYKLVEYTGRHYAKIYTNGKDNAEELVRIARKYDNLTIQVSNNYENYLKYQDELHIDFSVVVTKNNMPAALDRIRHLKEIGAKNFIFAFDFVRENINNPMKYSVDIFDFLNNVSLLTSDTFKTPSLAAPDPSFKNKFDEITVAFDFFSDNNFYATHLVDSEPICSIGDFNINATRKFFDESPCRKCKHIDMCRIGFNPQLLKNDMTQQAYDKYCIPKLITAQFTSNLKRKD